MPPFRRASSPVRFAIVALFLTALVTGAAGNAVFVKLFHLWDATDEVHIDLLFHAFPISLVVGALIGGLWVRRAGAAIPLFTGLALLAAATATMAILHEPLPLIASRAVEGVAAGLSWMAAIALVTVTRPDGARGKTIGIALSALALGNVAGSIVGTFAAVALAPDPALAILAALPAAAAVLCRRLERALAVAPATPHGPARGHLTVVLGLLGGLALLFAASVIPPTPVLSDAGTATAVVALVGLVAGIGLPTLWGRLADRRRPTTLVGLGFGAVLGAHLLSSVDGAFVLAAFLVVALGGTLALTAAVTWLANVSQRAESGTLSSAVLTATMWCVVPAMSFSPFDLLNIGTTAVALIAVIAAMALQAMRGGDTAAGAPA